jgi:hypothetical protein
MNDDLRHCPGCGEWLMPYEANCHPPIQTRWTNKTAKLNRDIELLSKIVARREAQGESL